MFPLCQWSTTVAAPRSVSSLLYKQHATALLHESIYTLRYRGNFPLRCTHRHAHTHTWGGPLMRYHFVISHAVLQDVSPLPKRQQQPQLCPCLVFPSRLHTPPRSHTPWEMERAWLPRYKWLQDSLSVFLPCTLTCTLASSRTHRRTRTRTHTPVVSWNHYTDILCGCHVHRNDDLALKLLFFTSLDSLKWILPVNYQVILFLCFTLKIILTQQYSFCLPDWKFSHY